ncbi:Pro-Pol polyprotein [Merluccius polli]|uniref:Gypsy retrotransposon integrase-like protein 1 n=1 Tax=Merluccius polli TaxID=89951 RepID=A0AA47MMU5_MERPO|nr:Pro-Pol polyprotein [Merluccius polli]
MKTAHDILGHSGVRKTYDRVMRHFYWPKLKKDVAAYIKTCHICQMTGKPNQVIKPAPLQPIPVEADPSVAAQEQEEIRAPDDGVLRARLNNSDTLKQLPKLLQHLSEDKCAELVSLVHEFPMLFADTPTQTHLLKHDIDVGDPFHLEIRHIKGKDNVMADALSRAHID